MHYPWHDVEREQISALIRTWFCNEYTARTTEYTAEYFTIEPPTLAIFKRAITKFEFHASVCTPTDVDHTCA